MLSGEVCLRVDSVSQLNLSFGCVSEDTVLLNSVDYHDDCTAILLFCQSAGLVFVKSLAAVRATNRMHHVVEFPRDVTGGIGCFNVKK